MHRTDANAAAARRSSPFPGREARGSHDLVFSAEGLTKAAIPQICSVSKCVLPLMKPVRHMLRPGFDTSHKPSEVKSPNSGKTSLNPEPTTYKPNSLQLITRVLQTGFLTCQVEATTALREHWDSAAKSGLGRCDLPKPRGGQSAPAALGLPFEALQMHTAHGVI